MKIYLDDSREKPSESFLFTHDAIYLKNDWMIVKNYQEFVTAIHAIIAHDHDLSQIECISFDHDLADEHYNPKMLLDDHQHYNALYETFLEKTGLDCVKFLIEVCLNNNFQLPPYLIHTQNPVGYIRIKSLLDNFKKHQLNGNGNE